MAGPIYTYTLCTPDSASPMNQTAPLIRGNFQAINELLEVNHVGWQDSNSSTNLGDHNFCSLPSQSSSPGTSSNEAALFCSTSTGDNPYEIYYQYPNNGEVVELTNQGTVVLPPPSGISNTFVFESGFVLTYGFLNGSTAGIQPCIWLNSIGGDINPPFQQPPFCQASVNGYDGVSVGAYSTVTSYNITQTEAYFFPTNPTGYIQGYFIAFGF